MRRLFQKTTYPLLEEKIRELNMDMANNYKDNAQDDFAELEISAHHHSGGKGTSFWDLSMAIGMEDGKAVRFCLTDFDRQDPDRHITALETMTEIKGLFHEDAITIVKEEKIGRIIGEYNYEGQQVQMLQELFDVNR